VGILTSLSNVGMTLVAFLRVSPVLSGVTPNVGDNRHGDTARSINQQYQP